MNIRLSKGIIFILAIVFILLGMYKVYSGNIGDASLSVVSGFLLLLFTNIENIESIKALGLEAKLTKSINEANVLISQLRNVITPQTEMLFSTMAYNGRYGKISRREEARFVERITEQLRSIGVSEEQIDIAKKDVYFFNAIDIGREIVIHLTNLLLAKEQEARTIFNNLSNASRGGGLLFEAEAGDIRKWAVIREAVAKTLSDRNYDELYGRLIGFIDSPDVFTPEEKEKIMEKMGEQLEDLRFFITTKKIRRPDVWFSKN